MKRKIDGTPTKTVQEHNERIDKWERFFKKEEDLQGDKILGLEGQEGKEVRFKSDDETIAAISQEIKSALLKNALKAKEIENISSAKEKLEAVKVFDLKDLIEQTNKAVKNIENEYKSKKRKGEVLQEARKILKIKGGILGEEKYTSLKEAVDELDNTSAKDKKDPNQNKKLEEGIKKVLEEAEKISNQANEALNNAKAKLDKYKDSNSEKAKALIGDIGKLKGIEGDLKKIKDKISEPGTTLEGIKIEIEKEVLKERIPRITLGEIQKKTGSDLEEVKEILDKVIEKTISEISVIEVILKSDKLESTLKEFLGKFRFVINYPDVDKLNSLIGKEVGEDFKLLNADLATHSFQKDMLDWFKEKGGRFLSKKDGNGFFSSIKEKIDTLMTSGLGKAYPEKLRAYGIRSKKNLESLNNFLSSKSKQVFHLITQSTRLGAIKVLQTLESDEFKGNYSYLAKEDGYIFMRLRTLLRQETQKYATDAFSSEKTHDLLVIECQPKTQEKGVEIGKLYGKLSSALKNSSKKIILIAQGEDTLAGNFNIPDENKIEDQTSFEDLDPKSQDKVLERKVNFQGKEISLNQLIDKNSAGGIIDQGSLSRLLEEEKIPIGDQNAFSSMGYVKDYYIERKFHRQRIKTEVLKEKADAELFFITEANKEDLAKLGAKKDNLHKWADGQTYDKGIILPLSSQSDQNNKEIFQKLGENVHWLEYQDDRLSWRASKGNSSALNEYIDKDYVPNEKNTLKEEEFSKPEALGQKVIIIANDAGMGKSTVLTSIARKMKGLDDNKKDGSDDVWTVRLDLNDYAFNKEKLRDHDRRKNLKSLKEISFEKDNINAAIDFVSKMAILGDPKDAYIQLQRKLFKAGLEKIVILFDGFDEISPTYKEKTHILLKALKESKVTRLWVTTRVHEKAVLEEKLEAPAYILNDLTEGEQKEFLNKFWRWSLKQKIQDTYEKIFDLYESKQKNEESQEETIHHLKQLKREIEALPDSLSGTSIQDLKNGISETLQKHLNQEERTINQLKSLQKAIDEKDENGKYKLDFSGYAETLLKQWKSSIKDTEKSFTNVPLNLRMLAEVVFEKKFQLLENLGLSNLYHEFIKIKLDIYKEEKAKAIQGNQAADIVYLVYSEKLGKIHCELALEEIFKEEELSSTDEDNTIKAILSGRRKMEKFKKLLHSNEKDAKTEIQRAGLMSFLSDSSPRFIHRSFAEYFLSEYLVRNLKNEQVQKLLLEKILLKEDYALIRKFFNGQLELFFKYKSEREKLEKQLEENSISQAEFDKKLLEIKGKHLEHLSNVELTEKVKASTTEHLDQERSYRYSGVGIIKYSVILHLSIQENHIAIIKFLLDKFNQFPILFEDLILSTDNWGKTVLHLAAEYGHHEIFQLILNSVNNNSKITINTLVLKQLHQKNILHFASEKGYYKTVQLLLEWGKDNLEKETLKDLVLQIDENKRSALHLAADIGHYEIVRLLLNFVKENFEKDYPNTFNNLILRCDENWKTVLHAAFGFGNQSDKSRMIADLILDSVKDDPDTLEKLVLASDKSGATALHWAASSGHTETLKTLLNFVRNHLKKDRPGTFKELVLKPDDWGKTALHRAVEDGHTDTVKALLDQVKEHLKDEIPPNTTLKELVLASDENERTALDS